METFVHPSQILYIEWCVVRWGSMNGHWKDHVLTRGWRERMAKKIHISKQDPNDIYVLGKSILIDFWNLHYMARTFIVWALIAFVVLPTYWLVNQASSFFWHLAKLGFHTWLKKTTTIWKKSWRMRHNGNSISSQHHQKSPLMLSSMPL